MREFEINQDNKQFKTWKEDLGWTVLYNLSIPRLTQKGHVGCKWQGGIKQEHLKKEVADKLYSEKLNELRMDYFNHKIAQFYIRKNYHYIYKTTCPKCGKDADILSFLMCCSFGTDDDRPSCPIVCTHCIPKESTYAIDNQVGVYYFEDMKFETEDGEEEFSETQYIITIDELKRKL